MIRLEDGDDEDEVSRKEGVMSQGKRYLVPEGMLKSARDRSDQSNRGYVMRGIEEILEVALRWLAENPIVPSAEETQQMFEHCHGDWNLMWAEWSSRMFLAPEPEDGEAVKERKIVSERIAQNREGLVDLNELKFLAAASILAGSVRNEEVPNSFFTKHCEPGGEEIQRAVRVAQSIWEEVLRQDR